MGIQAFGIGTLTQPVQKMIDAGTQVKVIGHRGSDLLVIEA